MRLNELLSERLEAENLSFRRAAELIGTSHSTVARAISGDKLDVGSMKKICDFLGVTIDSVLDIKREESELNAQIAMVLSMEPELGIVFEEIAEGIKAGTIDRDVLGEVAAFAAYRVSSQKKVEAPTEIPMET